MVKNRILSGLAVFAFMTAFAFSNVQPSFATSDSNIISIPVNTIIRGDQGSEHVVAEEEISDKHVGLMCSVSAKAINQGSVHPDNNLIVSSGDDSVVLYDVERKSHVITEAEGNIVLDEKVIVTLQIGKDRVFSGGMDVVFHCEKQVEVCRDGVIITIPESNIDPEDIKGECPVHKTKVCRDGEIITIPVDEVRESDIEGTCPVEYVKVCRDGEIVKVSEKEVLPTDEKPADCKEEPKELPNTGPASTLGLVASVIGTGLIAQTIVNRKADQS